jgi:hypothetical protein
MVQQQVQQHAASVVTGGPLKGKNKGHNRGTPIDVDSACNCKK